MATRPCCHGSPETPDIAVCRQFIGTSCVHKLHKQFPTHQGSKMDFFECFFCSDHSQRSNILCEACFRPSLCVFFTLFGCLYGDKGLGHNLPNAVFHPLQLKNGKFSDFLRSFLFFYILTIHNDQISDVKHVLDPLHVFFTLFGVFGQG